MPITVRPLTEQDDLAGWFTQRWGDDLIVWNGRSFTSADVVGLVADRSGTLGGVLTWVVEGDVMQFVSMDASQRREGIGSDLVGRAIEIAREQGLAKIILTTTNDNAAALVFWQVLGFRLVEVRPDAVTRARAIKPTIPQVGENGLEIRDELGMELLLG